MKKFKELFEATEKWLGTDNHNVYKDDDFESIHKNKKLNSKEKNSLENYTNDGYEDINSHYRNPDENYSPMNIKEQTSNIDSAIAKHTTEHNVHLWRGIHKDILKNVKEGDVFHDKGYVSTSTHPLSAKTFSTPGDRHVMHIKVPKGSKAIHLPNYNLDSASEGEVLLPRGSKFKYHGFTKDKYATVHHVTHIPESKNGQ